jgi:hypothetical protein
MGYTTGKLDKNLNNIVSYYDYFISNTNDTNDWTPAFIYNIYIIIIKLLKNDKEINAYLYYCIQICNLCMTL